jgi:hypothetical protein
VESFDPPDEFEKGLGALVRAVAEDDDKDWSIETEDDDEGEEQVDGYADCLQDVFERA